MAYINSTPPQAAKLGGRWMLGVGLVLCVLGFGDLSSGRLSASLVVAITVTAMGVALMLWGARRARMATAANRTYFSAHAGTEVLARRRRLQSRATRTRNVLLLVAVGLGAWWIVVASTVSCVDEVCTGFLPGHQEWLAPLRIVVIVLGIVTLALASFVRVHGQETDHWEEYASDALRRRDDGAVPGLRRGRWE